MPANSLAQFELSLGGQHMIMQHDYLSQLATWQDLPQTIRTMQGGVGETYIL